MIDTYGGFTNTPTTQELQREAERLERIARLAPIFPEEYESDDLAPARGALIGVIFGALCWMAIGLIIAAVRGW